MQEEGKSMNETVKSEKVVYEECKKCYKPWKSGCKLPDEIVVETDYCEYRGMI